MPGEEPHGPQLVGYSVVNSLTVRVRDLERVGAVLDEASLASHYGLSRTPLREVLQRLAGTGYITLEEHRGAKVASMDIHTMRTFFQTAPVVYANIVRLATENRTEEHH